MTRYRLPAPVAAAYQLVRNGGQSLPIRPDKLSSIKPRLIHSGFDVARIRHRRLHRAQNLEGGSKVSIVGKVELGERKSIRWRKKGLSSVARHDDGQLPLKP